MARPLLRRLCAAVVASTTVVALIAAPVHAAADGMQHAIVHAETHHDTSAPLSSMPAEPMPTGTEEAEPVRLAPGSPHGHRADPVIQNSMGVQAAVALGSGFDGLGQGFTGPQGTFSVRYMPPDTNAAVGTTQIVEIVNAGFAVFSKTGTVLYGPATTNTLFTGFGGACETEDDGDGVVRWDALANRWVITQFANTGAAPYYECVAVSQTADATGSWYRYAFQYSAFPDYPKLSVWPDAYYITYNMFGTSGFEGGQICAMKRSAMLTGATAIQLCFNAGGAYGSLLAADFEGGTAPPAGEHVPVVSLGVSSNRLLFWQININWTITWMSTFGGPILRVVDPFTPACAGGTCIPQAGTSQLLDSLGERLMFRAAYRNLGGHEALLLNHSVAAGPVVGIRWYEVRDLNVDSGGNGLTLYQQGTYAPGSIWRWMGSMAMDKVGNIGLGYAASSSSIYPGIRVTGRLAGDAKGTMTQTESVVKAGGGYQTADRWGDYSSMVVDPVDGCTFWYAQEYLPASGQWNWKTRLHSFTLPNCA
jgi:hypothetical protein